MIARNFLLTALIDYAQTKLGLRFKTDAEHIQKQFPNRSSLDFCSDPKKWAINAQKITGILEGLAADLFCYSATDRSLPFTWTELVKAFKQGNFDYEHWYEFRDYCENPDRSRRLGLTVHVPVTSGTSNKGQWATILMKNPACLFNGDNQSYNQIKSEILEALDVSFQSFDQFFNIDQKTLYEIE